MLMPAFRVSLTLIVMELTFVDLPAIAVSIGGVCANTQGSLDCGCDGTGFCGPTCDSCKYKWYLC